MRWWQCEIVEETSLATMDVAIRGKKDVLKDGKSPIAHRDGELVIDTLRLLYDVDC